jgi:CheY-like chemotaxis protein
MAVPKKVSDMSSSADGNDVIVADNDHVMRDILRSVLEAEGLTVLPVADGEEAIEYATRTHANLLVLDYKMPRLDGISACAVIRSLPGYAETPILVVTAFDSEDTRAAAREAGVTAFLSKPFTSHDLIRVVRNALGLSPAADDEPPIFVWRRRPEPLRLFGESVRLAEGRRLLSILRRDHASN